MKAHIPKPIIDKESVPESGRRSLEEG